MPQSRENTEEQATLSEIRAISILLTLMLFGCAGASIHQQAFEITVARPLQPNLERFLSEHATPFLWENCAHAAASETCRVATQAVEQLEREFDAMLWADALSSDTPDAYSNYLDYRLVPLRHRQHGEFRHDLALERLAMAADRIGTCEFYERSCLRCENANAIRVAECDSAVRVLNGALVGAHVDAFLDHCRPEHGLDRSSRATWEFLVMRGLGWSALEEISDYMAADGLVSRLPEAYTTAAASWVEDSAFGYLSIGDSLTVEDFLSFLRWFPSSSYRQDVQSMLEVWSVGHDERLWSEAVTGRRDRSLDVRLRAFRAYVEQCVGCARNSRAWDEIAGIEEEQQRELVRLQAEQSRRAQMAFSGPFESGFLQSTHRGITIGDRPTTLEESLDSICIGPVAEERWSDPDSGTVWLEHTCSTTLLGLATTFKVTVIDGRVTLIGYEADEFSEPALAWATQIGPMLLASGGEPDVYDQQAMSAQAFWNRPCMGGGAGALVFLSDPYGLVAGHPHNTFFWGCE